MNIDYKNIEISGLNYVRELKDVNGETCFYILIDNFNKPVSDVYHFLKERKKRYGDTLNSVKRKVYDLCILYDFMSTINITPELLTYNELNEFCGGYMKIIDPNFRVNDTIERSMVNRLPILEEYKRDNVSILDNSKTIGYDEGSIIRISNNVKLYLMYLYEVKNRDIDLNKIFTIKEILVNADSKLLGHRYNNKKFVYSVNGVLKSVGIYNINSKVCSPIEVNCIFEKEEEKSFFYVLSQNKNPLIKLLFYLIRKTGLRISEALAIQIEKYNINDGDKFLTTKESDIRCKSKEENIWEVSIVCRPENPPDLKIKNNKSRVVQFIDTDQTFFSLYRQCVFYRNITMKAKKKKHKFMFINRSGGRLKYQRTYQIFNEVLQNSGLHHRKGELTIHSFRHTYASVWVSKMKKIDADVELDQLARILGHENSKTTRETYIHFFREDNIKLLKKMEDTKFQER